MSVLKKIVRNDKSRTTILIRIMVGVVFLSEGIQKFLYPATRGAGRFAKIGLPSPEFLGSLVGGFEVVCCTLVLIGLFTRVAVIPLITIMVVALFTTKLDILVEKGFWEMMHASRTDFAMLLGSIFLFLKGSGKYSLERSFFSTRRPI